ncbi:MAG: bifunctional riboflavin kinase/FAD synthetase [Alphaproteobacteria bacterium]
MRIIRDVNHCPDAYKNTVLALGNFDGMHKGHVALIKHCVSLAHDLGTTPAVLTFEPHPREFFSPNKTPVSIYSCRQKIEHLKALGIACVFVLRFNHALAATSAHDFVHNILSVSLRTQHVLTGYNFAFGKDRGGNTEFLAQHTAVLGIGFTAMPEVKDMVGTISTSAIRTSLAQGNVIRASQMLGHRYALAGHVAHGNKRGKTIGFATANIAIHHLSVPCFGVYAVRAVIENTTYDGVANIGIKPTFGGETPVLETHIFDFNQNIYGKRLRVEFMDFIRPEKKFETLDDLRKQIQVDVLAAKEKLREYA